MSVISATVQLIRRKMNVQARVTEWEERGKDVLRYRKYFDGDHDVKLTEEMRKRLRIPENTQQLVMNYIPLIVRTMSGRLGVESISAETKEGTAWLEKVLEHNRFDLLQATVHDAELLDGDAYVMVSYDADADLPLWTYEPAYDGTNGIIPVYYNDTSRVMACAIKIWEEYALVQKDNILALDSETRVNVYYPDRVEKYRSKSGSQLEPRTDPGDEGSIIPLIGLDGEPLGVPIIHFANRRRENQGRSEVADAIPPQDILNRAVYTLVATAEAMGFPNRVAIGWNPESADTEDEAPIAPGDWLVAAPEGLMPGQEVKIETLEAGNLTYLIELVRHLVREIGTITSTPAPEIFLSDSISGEAFKTREASLVTKCRVFQLDTGSCWEQVADLAWYVQMAYGLEKPPEYKRARSRWKDVDIRSAKDVMSNATLAVQSGKFSTRAYLRAIAPVFELDEQGIEQILRELDEDAKKGLQMAGPNPMNGSYVNMKSTTDAVEKQSSAKEPSAS